MFQITFSLLCLTQTASSNLPSRAAQYNSCEGDENMDFLSPKHAAETIAGTDQQMHLRIEWKAESRYTQTL